MTNNPIPNPLPIVPASLLDRYADLLRRLEPVAAQVISLMAEYDQLNAERAELFEGLADDTVDAVDDALFYVCGSEKILELLNEMSLC